MWRWHKRNEFRTLTLTDADSADDPNIVTLIQKRQYELVSYESLNSSQFVMDCNESETTLNDGREFDDFDVPFVSMEDGSMDFGISGSTSISLFDDRTPRYSLDDSMPWTKMSKKIDRRLSNSKERVKFATYNKKEKTWKNSRTKIPRTRTKG